MAFDASHTISGVRHGSLSCIFQLIDAWLSMIVRAKVLAALLSALCSAGESNGDSGWPCPSLE